MNEDLENEVLFWFELQNQPIPKSGDIIECCEARDPFLAACWPYFYVPFYREGGVGWIRVKFALRFIAEINRRRKAISPRISDLH